MTFKYKRESIKGSEEQFDTHTNREIIQKESSNNIRKSKSKTTKKIYGFINKKVYLIYYFFFVFCQP